MPDLKDVITRVEKLEGEVQQVSVVLFRVPGGPDWGHISTKT